MAAADWQGGDRLELQGGHRRRLRRLAGVDVGSGLRTVMESRQSCRQVEGIDFCDTGDEGLTFVAAVTATAECREGA